jgi:hypothetical protein
VPRDIGRGRWSDGPKSNSFRILPDRKNDPMRRQIRTAKDEGGGGGGGGGGERKRNIKKTITFSLFILFSRSAVRCVRFLHHIDRHGRRGHGFLRFRRHGLVLTLRHR